MGYKTDKKPIKKTRPVAVADDPKVVPFAV
jgi:hypothetical protein